MLRVCGCVFSSMLIYALNNAIGKINNDDLYSLAVFRSKCQEQNCDSRDDCPTQSDLQNPTRLPELEETGLITKAASI